MVDSTVSEERTRIDLQYDAVSEIETTLFGFSTHEQKDILQHLSSRLKLNQEVK